MGDHFVVNHNPSAIGQPTWPTQPSIPQGSVNEQWSMSLGTWITGWRRTMADWGVVYVWLHNCGSKVRCAGMGATSLRRSTIANASRCHFQGCKALLLSIIKRRYIKYHAFAFLGGGIKRWCWLTSVWRLTPVAYIGPKSRTERPMKTKLGTEVAHVTRDSDTTFKVKRLKVKVTRLLCSPLCWRVRRLQRWAWERVGRGKLLLCCRLLGGARRFGIHAGRRGAGAYRGGRPPTACYY